MMSSSWYCRGEGEPARLEHQFQVEVEEETQVSGSTGDGGDGGDQHQQHPREDVCGVGKEEEVKESVVVDCIIFGSDNESAEEEGCCDVI